MTDKSQSSSEKTHNEFWAIVLIGAHSIDFILVKQIEKPKSIACSFVTAYNF